MVSFVATLFLVIFLLNSGKSNRKTEKAEENRVITVQSLPSLAVFGYYNYSAQNLLDNNNGTCWSVNLTTAIREGRYHGNILEGLVFVLEKPQIGSFVMWNGFAKTQELYSQNAAATCVTLTDLSNGRLLGEYSVKDVLGPFVAVVDKTLEPCSDGSYRVQVNFGTPAMSGVRRGTHYDDFCISEFHFWTGKLSEIRYPVGSRAVYDVKGPVRYMKDYDGTSLIFRSDGLQHSGKITYSLNAMTLVYTEQAATVTETYNNDGVLISQRRDYYYYSGYRSTDNTTYSYDFEGRLVSKAYSGSSGSGEYRYTYDNGYLSKVEQWVDSASGRVLAGEPQKFEVLEADSFGNWTKRRIAGTKTEQVRTIEYYQ